MRYLLLFLVVAGLGYGAYAYIRAEEAPARTATFVTAEAVRGSLREHVTASGTINAVTTVEVGSQLSGLIDKLYADFNDEVTAGAPLARLEQTNFIAKRDEAAAALRMAEATVATREAELERARQRRRDIEAQAKVSRAQIKGARARLRAAKAELERSLALRERGTATERRVEKARAEHDIALAALHEAEAELAARTPKVAGAAAEVARQKAELAQARASVSQKQAQLQVAEFDLKRSVIRSPIDGVVIERNVDRGQTVAASLEAPTLFTIARDLHEMEVHASVDETDIGRIQVGQRAAFTVDAYPGREFAGKVTEIRKAHEVVQNVVTYTVVIRTDNADLALLPGMTALVRVRVMESGEVLKVPSAAFDYTPGDPALARQAPAPAGEQEAVVWRLSPGGRPEPVVVETGASDSSSTAVTAGDLAEGDRVVTREVTRTAEGDVFGIRVGF